VVGVYRRMIVIVHTSSVNGQVVSLLTKLEFLYSLFDHGSVVNKLAMLESVGAGVLDDRGNLPLQLI
jgi:hypothetical protein